MGIFWRFRGVRDSVLGSSEFFLLFFLLGLLLLSARTPLELEQLANRATN